MAKYDVTHACGHTVTHQLYGRDRGYGGRIERREWLATQPCMDCKRVVEAEERAELNAENAELNRAADLPDLTGTEKQIAWAETIRREKVRAMAEEMMRLVFRTNARIVELGDAIMPEQLKNASAREQRMEAMMTWFVGHTDANWWIDHRQESDSEIWNMAHAATKENAE